jgi:uncharacterized protein (DUF305 family)
MTLSSGRCSPSPRLLGQWSVIHTRVATSPALTGSASAVTSSTATGSLSAEAAGIDRQFIDMMVPHHESAVEMAKLAHERAEHTELKSLALGSSPYSSARSPS